MHNMHGTCKIVYVLLPAIILHVVIINNNTISATPRSPCHKRGPQCARHKHRRKKNIPQRASNTGARSDPHEPLAHGVEA